MRGVFVGTQSAARYDRVMRSLLFTLALLSLAAVLGLARASFHEGSMPFSEGMEWVGSASTATSSPQALAFERAVAPYTERGVEVPRSIFESHYSNLGTNLMIDVLYQDPLCHVAAHELGRVIYAHTQNIVDSLAICQNKCADGCIHGALLELYHAPEGPNDPNPSALTPKDTAALAATCDNAAITKVTGTANCYHAIGPVLDAFAEA